MISSEVNRRRFLKAVSITSLGTAAVPDLALAIGGDDADWREQRTSYLEKHRRPDGGYAWEDQDNSHLTPTFAVIGCYDLLGRIPPAKNALAQFVRTHHPRELKSLEQEHRQFEFQQIQSLLWLGEGVTSFRRQVSSWKKPTGYLKQYEQHGYPVFASEVAAFTCRALLGLPLEELSPDYVEYVNSRRRANGSFNNTPSTAGGDGHVMNTLWGLQALRVVNGDIPLRKKTVEWLKACQLPNGGFSWQPNVPFAGSADAAYTWAAMKALRLLGSKPANQEACLGYLLLLAGEDGGFGDRPGWVSNPMATYYALDALSTLEALPRIHSNRNQTRRRAARLPAGLQVFTIQIEAHGKGSPAEAVDLARALRVHLWGAKNAHPDWLARAQALANEQQVPVTFFVSNEEYGTWVDVPGLGTYSHTSDIVAPCNSDPGPSLADPGPVSWPDFREHRLVPLQKAAGRLIWQFGENEELVRLLLDDSLERGGYAAISTFHFGNPDFTNSEPFLKRYAGQLPFVALQDAHGEEPWWFADMTTGFRTLFLGHEPTWEAWTEALRKDWVMAVRHDKVSGFKTWMHGGTPATKVFALERKADWQWWDNPLIERPMVSLVALTANDRFETARPESGITLRVRCAWENTAQGLPKTPLAELVALLLDGIQISPRLVVPSSAKGVTRDHYHEFRAAGILPGKHTASVTARVLATNQRVNRSLNFTV